MGSGKTTIANMLSDTLNIKALDSDEFIETRMQITINDIFNIHGESFFRKIEADIIKELSSYNSHIISTGGGVLENQDNFANLKLNGIIFYLKASAEVLYKRIKDCDNRPLLKTDNPLQVLRDLLIKRELNYNKADFVIDTDEKTVDDVVKEIIFLAGKQ